MPRRTHRVGGAAAAVAGPAAGARRTRAHAPAPSCAPHPPQRRAARRLASHSSVRRSRSWRAQVAAACRVEEWQQQQEQHRKSTASGARRNTAAARQTPRAPRHAPIADRSRCVPARLQAGHRRASRDPEVPAIDGPAHPKAAVRAPGARVGEIARVAAARVSVGGDRE